MNHRHRLPAISGAFRIHRMHHLSSPCNHTTIIKLGVFISRESLSVKIPYPCWIAVVKAFQRLGNCSASRNYERRHLWNWNVKLYGLIWAKNMVACYHGENTVGIQKYIMGSCHLYFTQFRSWRHDKDFHHSIRIAKNSASDTRVYHNSTWISHVGFRFQAWVEGRPFGSNRAAFAGFLKDQEKNNYVRRWLQQKSIGFRWVEYNLPDRHLYSGASGGLSWSSHGSWRLPGHLARRRHLASNFAHSFERRW